MVFLCGHCGNPRKGGAPTYRCTCIPAHVWEDPDLAQAVRTLNLSAVIRFLRQHPETRHLSQTALANMCGFAQSMISRLESGLNVASIRRAVEALTGLGAPGVSEGTRWRLPDDTTPLPQEPPQATLDAPCVVITSPVPIYVQVMDAPGTLAAEDPYQPEIAFIADPSGPRLIVTRDIPWGVTSAPGGATAWFALTSNRRRTALPPTPI
ncbi:MULTISPECIES: helix-turn-helix domain-containing protein [unclassified Nocardiopsis]|uniref:helix-turn-helix domain-containing protein n=1 Tax=unclassified Nocardiopsis TaxID=2649073 RepID=UPI0013575AD7|nr:MULTISPECIES: helix-turn-helix transcriptional regulator [unclassified Nocardiopsis]